MSDILETRVKPQFYLDSVALMRLSRTMADQAGVVDAAMMMATPANIAILHNAGLLESATMSVTAGDLLICVRADTRKLALSTIADAERLLEKPQKSHAGDAWQPRSIRAAVESHPQANLALISVPGAFAVSEARKAIHCGLHVMIFSDNVPLADEVTLKHEALGLGRLIMGPDCGTSIINGVPLAFANVVLRGDIGIVGASGTGIQEVSCLLTSLNKGVSHAIGVGGRDLSSEVGGISTLMALDLLEADRATRHIILISKTPAAAVAESVLKHIANSSKLYTICFIGGEPPALPPNARWAGTLMEAAETAADAHIMESNPESAETRVPVTGKLLRGLFCGGTLCAEAQVICKGEQLTLSSNSAIPGVQGTLDANGHTLIDLGADEYTQGKPHPMIEPAIRNQPLLDALADSRTGVVLLDVVIGHGAHADPAGQLVQSLPTSYDVSIIASVTGTEQDPQVRSRQVDTLRRAGILVSSCNAHAVRLALRTLSA